MHIKSFCEPDLKEDYIDIHYREKNREIQGILDYFEAYQIIMAKSEEGQVCLSPGEIYYCEMVDRKCFAYLEKDVYQLDLSIRDLLERLSGKGFVRIGKSMIVNVYKIRKLKPNFNMKIKIYLKNQEIVILNRTYKKSFMEYLQNLQEVPHGTD